MTDGTDIDRFVKDPSLLVELCREVVDRLDVGSEDAAVAEQGAQLQAIAKAVAQLEKAGVPVPDPLRAEKTRLAASLQVHTSTEQALAQLADEFQGIVKDLRDRLKQTTAAHEARPRAKRLRLPRTPKEELRPYILRALKTLGGRALCTDVMDEVGRQLEGKLLPGDKVWREATNEPAWRNNVKWERLNMAHEGILRHDSPHGVWELGEGCQ